MSWTHGEGRVWIRVVMKGETEGDNNITGTVNTIEIPSLTSNRQFEQLNVGAGATLYDTEQIGSGNLLVAYFYVGTVDARDNLRPRLVCDGVEVLPFDATLDFWYDAFVDKTEGVIYFSKHTDADHHCLCVKVPYPFKKRLKLGFKNDGGAVKTGYVSYSYQKLT